MTSASSNVAVRVTVTVRTSAAMFLLYSVVPAAKCAKLTSVMDSPASFYAPGRAIVEPEYRSVWPRPWSLK